MDHHVIVARGRLGHWRQDMSEKREGEEKVEENE